MENMKVFEFQLFDFSREFLVQFHPCKFQTCSFITKKVIVIEKMHFQSLSYPKFDKKRAILGNFVIPNPTFLIVFIVFQQNLVKYNNSVGFDGFMGLKKLKMAQKCHFSLFFAIMQIRTPWGKCWIFGPQTLEIVPKVLQQIKFSEKNTTL